MKIKKPPANDPSLPSFLCPEYTERLEWWQTMKDCCNGDLNRLPNKEDYLPRKLNEPEKGYADRLKQSPYEEHVQAVINSYAGAISTTNYSDKIPNLITTYENNIDLKNNSLSVFLDLINIASLRDGYVFVLIDYRSNNIQNRADEINNPSRPFLRIIDARQVINWHEENGKIERVTIAEEYHIKDKYGYTCRSVYRCIEGDTYRLVELVLSKEEAVEKWVEIPCLDDNGQEISGQFFNAKGQPLGYCPIVAYCLNGSWGESNRPEFLPLARQSIKLYQCQSDLWSIVNSLPPTPYYRGSHPEGLRDSSGYVSLGPHDFLDLGSDPSAMVGYLQAQSDAVKPVSDLIDGIKSRIKDYNLNSIGDSTHQRTATEIRTLFLSTQDQLNRLATRKASGIQSILSVLADYLGIDPGTLPEVAASSDISALLFDEASISLLYKEGLLSRNAAVRRLSALGYTENPEEELELLTEADNAQTADLSTKMMSPNSY